GAELHAMNYMIELFLDESNSVSRTRIHHIQSDKEEAWDNWDEASLVAFFKRRPELNLAKPVQVGQDTEVPHPTKSKRIKAALAPETHSASASTNISETKAVESQSPIEKPYLRKLEIIPAQSDFPCASFDHDQAFNVRLYLDLATM